MYLPTQPTPYRHFIQESDVCRYLIEICLPISLFVFPQIDTNLCSKIALLVILEDMTALQSLDKCVNMSYQDRHKLQICFIESIFAV